MNDVGSTLASGVIFLFAQNDTGHIPIGTAFIVAYPVSDQANKWVPLVVTAKHVIGAHAKVFGRFSTQDGKMPATFEYDLVALRANGDYWEHTDPGLDIAVFRTPHFTTAKYEPIPLELIASRDDFKTAQIQTTDRVVLPGLLINFMGLARNYPIIRSGSIALIPDEPIPMRYAIGAELFETKQDAILVDATAIPGESGSPVFLWPGPRLQGNSFAIGGTKPFVLGVLHGFYPAEPREVSTIQADAKQVYSENSNIAIVIPSWRLREILESTAVANRIKSIVADER